VAGERFVGLAAAPPRVRLSGTLGGVRIRTCGRTWGPSTNYFGHTRGTSGAPRRRKPGPRPVRDIRGEKNRWLVRNYSAYGPKTADARSFLLANDKSCKRWLDSPGDTGAKHHGMPEVSRDGENRLCAGFSRIEGRRSFNWVSSGWPIRELGCLGRQVFNGVQPVACAPIDRGSGCIYKNAAVRSRRSFGASGGG